uniref:Uncharacterized protein n=1 Tax=Chaetoceros debilis TaxID=122233 RepID=A0A7S3QIT5_9STRA
MTNELQTKLDMERRRMQQEIQNERHKVRDDFKKAREECEGWKDRAMGLEAEMEEVHNANAEVEAEAEADAEVVKSEEGSGKIWKGMLLQLISGLTQISSNPGTNGIKVSDSDDDADTGGTQFDTFHALVVQVLHMTKHAHYGHYEYDANLLNMNDEERLTLIECLVTLEQNANAVAMAMINEREHKHEDVNSNSSVAVEKELLQQQIMGYEIQVETLTTKLHTATSVSSTTLSEAEQKIKFTSLQHENAVLAQKHQELKQAYTALHQQNTILKEGHTSIEDENKGVTQRCVELEQIATDATTEVEGLMYDIQILQSGMEEENRLKLIQEELKAELQCVKEDLEMVCVERDELLSEKEEYKGLEEQLANTKEMHRNREKECLVQTKESEQQWREKMEDQEDDYCRVRKDLEEELNEVRARCCKLEQENGEYAGELTVLRDNGTNLASELETSKKALAKHTAEVQSLQSELDKTITTADKYQQLQQERDDLSKAFKALELRIADLNEHNVTLQDDCSRLRNVNAMMKTKMVADASESSTVMGQKDGYLKQIASLTEQTQSLQTENIALSDHKTDMQLEMNKMEKECKDLTASLSRI